MEHQNLLGPDGSASMATMLLMSHHAFRRDIFLLGRALEHYDSSNSARTAALQQEWQWYRGALHGHHEMEDTRIFPSILEQAPRLKTAIDRLSAEHRKIDPLLEQGDRGFAGLPATQAAAARVVQDLSALLHDHLAFEEAEAVPLLRNAHEFPSPANETEAEMYAQGFAWSSHGVASEVLERVYALLPELLRTKIPAARAAFGKRCEAVWGTAKAGASRTCVPEWLAPS